MNPDNFKKIGRNPGLETYMRELDKNPLLSPEEEFELFERIKAGDQEARDRVIKANLKFVISVAKQYQGLGLELGDLIGEGNLGLAEAVDDFDHTRGFKFITRAVWWIRAHIRRALTEQRNIIRIPVNKNANLDLVHKVREQLFQKLHREPTEDEVYEQAIEMRQYTTNRVTRTDVKDEFHKPHRVSSLDGPISLDEDETNTLLDVLAGDLEPPPDSGLEETELREMARKLLNELEEKERTVLDMFFGFSDPHTQLNFTQIAENLGLSVATVTARYKKALIRLKRMLENSNPFE
jgi:RNA polymerase primary sigma factor